MGQESSMEVDDYVDRPLQNIQLKTLLHEKYPFEIFRLWIDLDYDQLAKILQLDTGTAVQCKTEEPVERALRKWIAMHGKEATVGNIARQLIRDGHTDLLKSVFGSMGITANQPSLSLDVSGDTSNSFDVYLSGADSAFASAFVDSAEKRHKLQVFQYDRNSTAAFKNIDVHMEKSRFVVLALPAKSTSFIETDPWMRFEQRMAVFLKNDLDETSRTLIPVAVYERSSVPPILQCFSPLVKRGEENLDQFCDRICETILDQQKLQRRGTGLLARYQQDADQESKEKEGARSAVPLKASETEPGLLPTSFFTILFSIIIYCYIARITELF